jgi:hypothetical protein
MKTTTMMFLFLAVITVLRAAPGDVDLSFAPPESVAQGEVKSMVLQPSGKVVVGVGRVGNQFHITRLHADGTLDTSFNSGAVLPRMTGVNAIVEQPDGKLVIAGSFEETERPGFFKGGIVRIYSDGRLDESFFVGSLGATGSPARNQG